MEYRRRKNRRSRSGSIRSRTGYTSPAYSRQREGGSFFGPLLFLVLAALLIYVLAATPAGEWLLGKIIPKGNNGTLYGSPVPVSPIPDTTPVPTGSGETQDQTAEMEFPPLEMFALQLGVYDSADNAKGLISSLRSLGAAGYSLPTAEGVRILAACYTTEAAARSVCDRLNTQGYACIIHVLRTDGLTLGVTAGEAQLEAMHSAIDYAKGIIDDINEEVIRFDTEERSIEYGKAITNEMLENIRSVRTALASVRESSGAARLIDNYYMELTGLGTELVSADTENRVEFSGRLKAFQIGIIERYIALINALEQLG